MATSVRDGGLRPGPSWEPVYRVDFELEQDDLINMIIAMHRREATKAPPRQYRVIGVICLVLAILMAIMQVMKRATRGIALSLGLGVIAKVMIWGRRRGINRDRIERRVARAGLKREPMAIELSAAGVSVYTEQEVNRQSW